MKAILRLPLFSHTNHTRIVVATFFQGILILANGFLPTRGSFMLDVVFLAMFGIVAVLLVSICLVRYRRKIDLHRKIQMALAIVLAIAIVAFEIDVRFITDWRELAEASPFYASGFVDFWLVFHLCFAIPTPFVWLYVVVKAVKHFRPADLKGTDSRIAESKDKATETKSEMRDGSLGDHAAAHRLWGKIAAILMTMTALTGCVFYWISFVA